MDIQIITQLVGSLGFPIACCIYLIYTNRENEKNHKEEIDKLRETVDNNTIAITKLVDKFDSNIN